MLYWGTTHFYDRVFEKNFFVIYLWFLIRLEDESIVDANKIGISWVHWMLEVKGEQWGDTFIRESLDSPDLAMRLIHVLPLARKTIVVFVLIDQPFLFDIKDNFKSRYSGKVSLFHIGGFQETVLVRSSAEEILTENVLINILEWEEKQINDNTVEKIMDMLCENVHLEMRSESKFFWENLHKIKI